MKLYDKANSILEIKGHDGSLELILKNLKQAYKNVNLDNCDEDIRNAYFDLFNPKRDGDVAESQFFLRDHVVEEMARLNVDDYLRYIKYRYQYDMYPIVKKVGSYPPLVQIEPASICNYRCVFCYQTDKRLSDKKNGHMGVMDLGLFKEIIDQLDGNVEAITLASRGEPMVNRNLPQMLEYVSGKFLAFKVNTNASLLDEKMAHAILSSNLQTLVFSADAADTDLYARLRVNGNLDDVLARIEMFQTIKEKHYPDCRTITRVSGVKFSKEQEFSTIENFWKRYVDQVAFVDYNPWENIYDSLPSGVSEACSDLWRRMFVWWDGRIAPCDVDYLTKLSTDYFQGERIENIWGGQNYQKLRKTHIEGKRNCLNPCSKCVVI